MCTLVILQRLHPRYPVIIAANRDEFYARPSDPPALLHDQPRVVGGRDGERGGTWMGVTESGLFVGLTNQRTDGPPDKSLQSRGAVVLDALRAGSAEAVAALLGELDPAAYNPFNLLFGDARGMHAAYSRRDAARVQLEPVCDGLHVLPNDRLDTPFPKVERARKLVEPHVQTGWPVLRAHLRAAMADHHLPAPAEEINPEPRPDYQIDPKILHALQAICIHTPAYGTRSTTLVALEPDRVAFYGYADGPPCEAAIADHTTLVTSP